MEGKSRVETVEAVCSAAVRAAMDMSAPLILAVTASEIAARQLSIVRGVQVMLTAPFQGTDSVLRKALAKAKEDGTIKEGDQIVAVHGQKEECPGQTNLLKVVTVP